MNRYIGVCGCICSDCRVFQKSCDGCYDIEGKPVWLPDVDMKICDFYDCCVNEKKFSHCGECEDIPCDKFWKNKHPEWSEKQHKRIVIERVKMLVEIESKT
ncbi:MAG: DUF3795 domain-containing protein [Candidatus Cloacimonetes bacterium]|nr:DUF3795 domain-containing protein [Candidatus Cloacimonadota bacterium]MBS3768196.1 DUF3795 domain-containing protein [Candidatus Cloacimonadota bacterium]